jgi:hypothetical protein
MTAASKPIASLPGAVDAQRVDHRRHRVRVSLEGRGLVGARQAVIHERAGEQLSRLLVIDEMPGEGLAEALCHAAMDLASGVIRLITVPTSSTTT